MGQRRRIVTVRAKLSAKFVERVKTPGRYRDHDVRGLYLEVRAGKRDLAKSFVLRYMLDGRERWMGLGSARDVTLKDVRDKAREARSKLKKGVDPLASKTR